MLKEIGRRVKIARNAKGLSQAQLATALHLSVPYISHIEQGKQAMSVVTLSGLCRELEVSADWIIRNASPESVRITDEEIAKLLIGCTPAERSAMVRVLESMREAFHSIRDEQG